MENGREVLKNLKLYDPAIPLLGIYPDKAIIQNDICTFMFIAALFIVAKTWKQHRCPSTDEWMKKLWCTHTMEYSSQKIMPFAATWMQLETIVYVK